MDALTENFERHLVEYNPDQLELFVEDEYRESTFEEQHENEQFAQDGDMSNIDGSEIL
jgi:hypothetical protein